MWIKLTNGYLLNLNQITKIRFVEGSGKFGVGFYNNNEHISTEPYLSEEVCLIIFNFIEDCIKHPQDMYIIDISQIPEDTYDTEKLKEFFNKQDLNH